MNRVKSRLFMVGNTAFFPGILLFLLLPFHVGVQPQGHRIAGNQIQVNSDLHW